MLRELGPVESVKRENPGPTVYNLQEPEVRLKAEDADALDATREAEENVKPEEVKKSAPRKRAAKKSAPRKRAAKKVEPEPELVPEDESGLKEDAGPEPDVIEEGKAEFDRRNPKLKAMQSGEEGPHTHEAIDAASEAVSRGKTAEVKGALATVGVKRVSLLEPGTQVQAFLHALSEELAK